MLEARRRLRAYLAPTPFRHYPALSALVGAEIFVKHENVQPTGAFKVRGGINLVSRLEERERASGLIAASTGNHGQSIAYAARLFGVKAVICAPRAANPTKVAAMRELGAEVLLEGADFDEARGYAERLAEERGHRYVHSGDERLLIAGVATATMEMLEDVPDLDAIIVPVGGGSGAAGACVAGKAMNADIKVIAVQSSAAPAAYRSWRGRTLVTDRMNTAAEGLATRVGFDLPQRILWEQLDDFVLVSEDEIRSATRQMIEITRTLVEAAGAAPLAAALRLRDRLRGSRVGLICTGANISLAQLGALLSGSSA
ncbi:MAG: pyridoxal-phosphate dependent enzyme [Chloroflexota bacterium]|nr:pyridoxal-phosphate dependent enzyme [Chloroflexota bacterium]